MRKLLAIWLLVVFATAGCGTEPGDPAPAIAVGDLVEALWPADAPGEDLILDTGTQPEAGIPDDLVEEITSLDLITPVPDTASDVPKNLEKCNGVDDDGDGITDEPGAEGCAVFYADHDGDGFGLEDDSLCLCVTAPPYIAIKFGDCDDTDSGTNPNADEICYNDIDEDCDGATWPQCGSEACGPDQCGGACGSCPSGAYCALGQCFSYGCVPACAGKVCGTDGCGGICGECPKSETCHGGICKSGSCQAQCPPGVCGDDGCGGLCQSCTDKEYCGSNGTCVLFCTPDCLDKLCGDNGCGGQCGFCTDEKFCNVNFVCQCKPECNQQPCGTPGCGSCGSCVAGQKCSNGQCVACQANCAGKQCGWDGCGGTCGQCTGGKKCTNGQCVCQANCAGKQCGGDGCGGICGQCTGGKQCVNGQCVIGLPKMTFKPAAPTSGQGMEIEVTDDTPWAFVGLTINGPCGPVNSLWGGVDDNGNGTWTWHYAATPSNGGVHTFAFSADNGAILVHSQELMVMGIIGCQ